MTISLATKGMIASQKVLEGKIEIEPDRWQLISIPVKYGYYDIANNKLMRSKTIRATIYNYVVTQLESVYGNEIKNLIRVINSYNSDSKNF